MEELMVKSPPAVQETLVPSLGQEDPLEKEMATQYSCLENPMDRGAWWATVHGVTESESTEHSTELNKKVIAKGNAVNSFQFG